MKMIRETLYSRRETLAKVLRGLFATAVAAPCIARAGTTTTIETSKPEFVPENDYPFFGWNPEDAPTKTN